MKSPLLPYNWFFMDMSYFTCMDLSPALSMTFLKALESLASIDRKAWLAPCLADQPDLEALAKAPDVRFQSIDAKLSNALRKVIDNAGDKSMQVKYDMSMKNQLYGRSGDFKGRELFAMILISFKSPDHTEVLYNAHHLYMFNYYGDDQLEAF